MASRWPFWLGWLLVHLSRKRLSIGGRSGGKPLVFKNEGKTIFDLAKEHNDTFFLMYTNGTLINEEMT